MENKIIYKHFPADTTLYDEDKTFLTDKKVDEMLYAFLLENSYGVDSQTVVFKKDLPNQTQIAAIIGVGSRNTVRTHLNYLIKEQYIFEDKDRYIINKNKEKMYFKMEVDTIRFLNNTVKEPVYKAYIYLGQRWNYKGSQYEFTLEELGGHIAKKPNNNSTTYKELNDILLCLKNNGLIDYCSYYDGKMKKMRLTNFNTKVKDME